MSKASRQEGFGFSMSLLGKEKSAGGANINSNACGDSKDLKEQSLSGRSMGREPVGPGACSGGGRWGPGVFV